MEIQILKLPIKKERLKLMKWSGHIQYIAPLKEKKLYLLNKIHYSYFKYDTKLESTALSNKEDFHSIAYTVGIIKILPRRWQLIANLTPTIASDFKESLSSDDLVIQTSILAMKRSGIHFEYGFGLSHTTRFGNAFIVPIVNLTYKKNKWETLMVIPAYFEQNYLFSKKNQTRT